MDAAKYPNRKHNDVQTKPVRWFNIIVPIAIVVGAVGGYLVVQINQPGDILFALAGLVVLVVSIYSMEFGLLSLTFITYTRFSDVVVMYHNSPSVAKPLLVLLVLSILMRWALLRKPPQGWVVPALLLAIYGLSGFASLIYSPVPDRVWGGMTDYVKDATIAVVVVVLLQTRKNYRRLLWMMMLSGIFMGGLSVYQYATKTYDNEYGGFAITGYHQIIGDNDEYRVGGPLEDPNFFSQIMVVLVPISLERFFHEKRLRFKIPALASAALATLCVFLTYSRGGFLALILGLGVYFYFYPPKRYQIPLIIFAGVILISLAPPKYIDRISTLTEFLQPRETLRIDETSFQGRLSENLAALEMIKTNPLFGVGLRSYNYLFPVYSKNLGIALVAGEREAHNLYLEIAAETGIVGLMSFLLIVYVVFRTLFTARKTFLFEGNWEYAGMVTGFMAGLTGYLVAATFIHGAYPRYLYFLIGVALSLRQVASGSVPQENQIGRGDVS